MQNSPLLKSSHVRESATAGRRCFLNMGGFLFSFTFFVLGDYASDLLRENCECEVIPDGCLCGATNYR
jgi:hypothetical protein